MNLKSISVLIAGLVLAFCAPGVLAQDRGLSWFGRGDRGASEEWELCRQSIALAGVEDDMDARIRTAVGDVQARLRSRDRSGDRGARAFSDALDESLTDAKQPIMERLIQSCVSAFTVSELRGINAFYTSPAGRAWLRKGREIILPAVEDAIAEVQPRIRDDVEQRYCARMGC